MKHSLALLLCFGFVTPSHAGFDGLWLRCIPEWNRASPVMLLEIDKAESNWVAEWGQPYSASGSAKRGKGGALVLRGCSSYRGETSAECNRERPPVFLTLPEGLARNPARATAARLKKGEWIRTSKVEWSSLEKRCEALLKS